MATISDSVKVNAASSRRGLERVEAEQKAQARAVRGRLTTTETVEGGFSRQNIETAAAEISLKGGPVLFWLVAGIAVVKDLIDIGVTLMDALGTALTATAVGAVVGIPLGVLAEIIDKIAGMLIDFTLVAYFGYIGGGFALRLIIMSIGAIIDAIPFMEVLPLTTISFFAAYFFGRAAKAAVQSSGMAKKVVNVASKVAKVAKYV